MTTVNGRFGAANGLAAQNKVNHFEGNYLPNVLARDFSKESLRAFIVNVCHIHWSRAEQRIHAIAAPAEAVELLQLLVNRGGGDSQIGRAHV